MLDEYNYRYINHFKTISLTPLETYILSMLIQNKDKITKTKDLLKLFDEQEGIDIGNSLRVHIWYLRKKLKGEIMIIAVYGQGYKIAYLGG